MGTLESERQRGNELFKEGDFQSALEVADTLARDSFESYVHTSWYQGTAQTS